MPPGGPTGWRDNWSLWLSRTQPGAAFEPRGQVLSLYSLAVAEAVNGAGVLIGHEALLRPQLDSAALVAPFPTRVALDRRLTLTPAPSAKANPILEKIVAALIEDPTTDSSPAQDGVPGS